jgi:flagellar biosynthesis/type III secretory pathway protein FliH
MNPGKIIKSVAPNKSPGGSITKRHVVDARAEARLIIAAAEEDAAAIRQRAETFARESREKAYREGCESALSEWNTLLVEAQELRDQAVSGVEKDLLRLAVKIAEKILGREIKNNRETIVDIVANAQRNDHCTCESGRPAGSGSARTKTRAGGPRTVSGRCARSAGHCRRMHHRK